MAKLTIRFPEINLSSKLQYISTFIALLVKEIKTYFDSPVAYVTLVVAIFIHFLFFLIFGGFFQARVSELDAYFSVIPWIFIFLIPTLTMGSISNEMREGTIELIFSKPVGMLGFIFSKLLSVVLFIAIMFAVEFLLIFTLLFFGSFDFGKIFSQYVAVFLYATAFASFGIFVSSLTKNQISSFLITLIGAVVITLIGVESITMIFPPAIGQYFERLSMLSHFNSMLKGAIDMRDLSYFIGFASLFLILAYYKIVSFKLPSFHRQLRNLRIYTIVLVLIAFTVTAFGQKIPGRIDFTKYQVNSLTSTTKKILGGLQDKVIIDFYYSGNLPAGYQPIKRDVVSMLRDYSQAGGDNLIINYKSTDDEKNKSDAVQDGLNAINFQQIGSESFQVTQGYFGMVVKYKEKKEVIPEINRTTVNNLEYEITKLIKKEVATNRKSVGILNTGVAQTYEAVSKFSSFIGSDYEVKSVVIDDTNKSIPADIGALVVAGPNAEMKPEVKNELRRFFNDGGGIFLLVDPVNVQTMGKVTATKNPYSQSDFFADLGINVQESVVYDARTGAGVNYGDMMINYPFFPLVPPTENATHPVVKNVEAIMLQWGSWISIDSEKAKDKIDIAELFTTTKYSGFQKEGGYALDPTEDPKINKAELEPHTVAVAIQEKDNKPGRAVIVADSDIINSGIGAYGNGVFAMNSVDWLVQDSSLAEIKAKERTASPLVFSEESQLNLVVFGVPGVILFGIVAAGGLRFVLRRFEKRRVYVASSK